MDGILEACAGQPVAHFEPRDRLVLENDPLDAMFVLIEGELDVVRGGVPILTISAPGAMVGEMSALLGKPYSATVQARSRATAYRIDAPGTFLAERPVLLLQTAQLLAQRLDNATAYLSALKAENGGRDGPFGGIDAVLGTLMSQARSKLDDRQDE